MISNPCSWFINGNQEKKFTYEGGKTLFHFSPYDNNLSKYMGCNVVFFANDSAHALDVLKRMFKFRIQCAEEYVTSNISHVHKEEFITKVKRVAGETQEYLEAIESGKATVTEAPMTQFFTVGWACNSTILD